jgi:hypothetical protein
MGTTHRNIGEKLMFKQLADNQLKCRYLCCVLQVLDIGKE